MGSEQQHCNKKTRLSFVGMEISPEYLEIARARIESAKDES